MKSRKGFTLVELMITIAVLAIVAAIGGLSLHAYTLNRNLKSAAREIVSDFFVYRARAVSECKTYRIAFDIDGSSYTIQPGTSTPVTKSPLAFGSDIRIIAANFGGGHTVNFLARGTVSPFGNIKLENSRQSNATIKVNVMLPLPEVERLPASQAAASSSEVLRRPLRTETVQPAAFNSKIV